jgi:TonB family protein
MTMVLDADEPRGPSKTLWIAAASVALVLHASVIGGLWYAVGSDEDDDNGAPGVEISLDMTAPKAEQTDLPPGPEADAAAASPAQIEQTKKVEETSRPKDDPTDTENPDRVVAQEPPKKPTEEKPDPALVQTNASAESLASDAAAPAPSDVARLADKSAAPAQGLGDSARRVVMAWQKQLVAHLDRHKRYPPGGARRTVQVSLTFTIDRLGHVVSAAVLKSSGDASFDEAALAMLHRSDPVPAPPPLIADDGLTFTVPVMFREGGKH